MMGAWWLLVLPPAWLVARVLAERTWRPVEAIISGPADAVEGYRCRRRAMLAIREPVERPLVSESTLDPSGDPALPASRAWVEDNADVLAALRAAEGLPCWQPWPPEDAERSDELQATMHLAVVRGLFRQAALAAWADGDLARALDRVLDGIALFCDLSRGDLPAVGLGLAASFVDQLDALASVADAPCRQTAADRLRAIADRLPTPGERVSRTAAYTASLLVYPGNCDSLVDALCLPWPWRRHRLARQALAADVVALQRLGDGPFRSAALALWWSEIRQTVQTEIAAIRGFEKHLTDAAARLEAPRP